MMYLFQKRDIVRMYLMFTCTHNWMESELIHCVSYVLYCQQLEEILPNLAYLLLCLSPYNSPSSS